MAEITPDRILKAQLALHDAGFSAEEILQLVHAPKAEPKERVSSTERNDDIERRFRAGEVMEAVAANYGISRERVRQILRKRGLIWKDGGARVRSEIREERIAKVAGAYRDDHFQKVYGCSYAVMKEINGGENASRAGSMANLYLRQRNTSVSRSIEWRITLPEFARIWKESGRLDQRGRGAGKYCMSRNGDEGAYAADNVSIVLNEKNGRDGQANSKDKFIQRKWASPNKQDDRGYRPRELEAREIIASGQAGTPRELANALGIGYGTAYVYMRKVQAMEPHLVPRAK